MRMPMHMPVPTLAGVAMGIGRTGGIVSSAMGGLLPSMNASFVIYATFFALGAVVALHGQVSLLRFHPSCWPDALSCPCIDCWRHWQVETAHRALVDSSLSYTNAHLLEITARGRATARSPAQCSKALPHGRELGRELGHELPVARAAAGPL